MNLTETYRDINFCLRCGSKLELKADHENKIRPQCSNCGWKFYKNPIPASTCIILNEAKELLIIKRKFEPESDKWALPSGYVEIDQNPEDTAQAEMLEETGLEGKVIEFLGYYPDFSPIYEKVITFGFLMEITGGRLQAGDDASEACYVPLAETQDLAFASHNYFVSKIKEKIVSE
jgi:8-oxo-dGTP diphosphatase